MILDMWNACNNLLKKWTSNGLQVTQEFNEKYSKVVSLITEVLSNEQFTEMTIDLLLKSVSNFLFYYKIVSHETTGLVYVSEN